MEFTLPVTFDIDPTEWADEYDLAGPKEGADDICAVLTEAADTGALALALGKQWPMMRDCATITVGALSRDVEPNVGAGMTDEFRAVRERALIMAAGGVPEDVKEVTSFVVQTWSMVSGRWMDSPSPVFATEDAALDRAVEWAGRDSMALPPRVVRRRVNITTKVVMPRRSTAS